MKHPNYVVPQLKDLAQRVGFNLKKTSTLIFLLDFPFKHSHPFSSLLSSWRISLTMKSGFGDLLCNEQSRFKLIKASWVS